MIIIIWQQLPQLFEWFCFLDERKNVFISKSDQLFCEQQKNLFLMTVVDSLKKKIKISRSFSTYN